MPGAAAGLVGALVGLLLELAALQLGILLGALAWGVRVHHVQIGVGAKLREWTTPARRVVLRAVPLLFSVGIGPGRPRVRPRMWLTAGCSALVGLAAVAGTWLVSATPFGWGLALGATANLVHALLPRRTPESTSTGWFLFALPRLTGRRAAELDAAPLVSRVTDAVEAGDLGTAEQGAAELARLHPDLRTATSARVLVLTAQARYAEALALVSQLMQEKDQTPREMAFSLAGMAGLTATTVEAGQLPPDVGLPTARRAVEGAEALGYPRYRLTGTLALLALLDGDPHQAITLATQAAEQSESGLSRADDLATLARAQMAAGDNAAARTALADAERLAAWWPRVVTTRARLDIS